MHVENVYGIKRQRTKAREVTRWVKAIPGKLDASEFDTQNPGRKKMTP